MGNYHFILGGAGCGKSSYIYQTLTRRTIEEPDRQFYLFVPEQNTLKAQQELIRHSAVHGMLSLDVLSFTQLSYRVMEELDMETPDVLDEISRSVLMRKALGSVKDRLTVYRNKTGSQGFIRQLKSALSEFSQYGVTPEDLSAAGRDVSTPLLAGKLSDLETIFTEFRRLLNGGEKNHVIPEEVPALLLKNMERSRLLEGAVLYFDGFTGFTPIQLAIIERMAGTAAELYFSVTVPPEELHPAREHYTDLFWFSRETVKKVTDACTRAGILEGEPVCISGRRGAEKQVSGKLTVPESTEVEICGFDDPVEEIRYIASEIRARAVQQQIRYRRTAVAVSELASYREIIRREFSAAGIPFFIDDRAPAAGSPVVELLRSALLSIRENYAYEDVMTFLKNPLVAGEDREKTDVLDNFVRAAGLRGRKAWQEDWSLRSCVPKCAGENLNGLEALKESGMAEVFRLQDALKEAETCGEKAEKTAEFLRKSIPEDAELSGDDLRFLELSQELLERLASLFSEEKMSIGEFADLVEAGFSDMKAGMIPASMDTLSVGDLKRSRFDDIDDLYLVGANEGKIPQTVTGGGIFTDRERMELTGKDLELAPDDRHDAVIQNYYLYLYLHKPVRRLTITFAAADRDGGRQKPSVILTGASVRYPETEPVTGSALLNEFASLLSGSGRKEPEGKTEKKLARDWKLLTEDPELRAKAEAVLAASLRVHVPEQLKEATAGLLYGSRICGSVTRLEEFEKCPYHHFLDYGIGLRERETFDVEAVDVGRLYHEALDSVLRELRDSGRDLGSVESAELEQITVRKVRELTENYNGSVMRNSARSRYVADQVERIAKKTLEKLSEQYRLGAFRTAQTEYRFESELEGMHLTGRIDRVDRLEENGKTYIKVIDYKSGSAEFEAGRCYEGLQMQLAAYMQAALDEAEAAGGTAVPAGMFLYNIKDPILTAGKEADNASAWRMNGLCIDDPEILRKMDRTLGEKDTSEVLPVKLKKGVPSGSSVMDEASFRLLLQKNRERMQQDAGRIRRGEIEARPVDDGKRTGCDYCPMRTVCGFDRRIDGYGYRAVQVPSCPEVIRKLTEEM